MSVEKPLTGSDSRCRLRIALFASLVLAFLICHPAFAQEDAGTPGLDPAAANLERARELLREMDAARQEIQALIESSEGMSGEELDLKRVPAVEIVDGLSDHTVDLLNVLPALDKSIAARDSILHALESHLRFQAGVVREAATRNSDRLAETLRLRGGVPPEGRGRFEARVGEHERFLDSNLARILEIGRAVESAGFDAPEFWEWMDDFLAERAGQLRIRLQLAVLERRRALEQIEAARELGITPDEDQLLLFHAAEIRVDAIVSSLSATADLMDARGLPAAKYRILAIRTTGSITEHILNYKVFLGLVRGGADDILGWLKHGGPTALVRFGIVILFGLVFRLLGWFFWNLTRLFLRPPKLLGDLIGRLVRPISTITGILAGLWFLGVNPTTLLAGLGVAGVIVGLALQDSLSNLAAGLFILIYKPYDVDEVIQAGGVLGRVKEMGLANTTIITFDNRRFFVPNRKVWGDIIENRSLEKVRRVQATVHVSYDDDIVEVLRHISKILEESDLVLDTPAPAIFVSKLDDSWLEVSVWPWTKTENWWALESQLPLILRVGLAERGVTVPYPRREIDLSPEARPEIGPGV